MADVFNVKKRSEIMSHIRSKNTKLESDFLKLLKKSLRGSGCRCQKHYAGLKGKPDVAFPTKKVAVFIDGCFWHGCRLHSRTPLSNVYYWKDKLTRNMARDKEVTKLAKRAGWKVVRLWEHQIKKNPGLALHKIEKELY